MKEILREKIQLISKKEIIKQMGYNNKERGLNSLEKFLSSKNLYSWIHSGNYDFKYAPIEFFKTLCKIINIPDKDVEKELKNCDILEKELNKIKYCYIFINTNFRRVNQPIFALAALQHYRIIAIPKDKLLFKTDKEIFSTVSTLVKNHYKNSSGKILMWGKIVNYKYYHSDDQDYVFDIDGKQIEVSETIFESKVELKIKNKNIFFLSR